MKGLASVLTVILTIIFLLSIALTINFAFSSGFTIKQKVSLQQDLYTMNNALDAAKLYLDTALKFSTYQAAFDYGQQKNQDANPQSMAAGISKKISENLNKYTKDDYKFLSDKYKVKLPQYAEKALTVQAEKTKLKITAKPEANLRIDRESQEEKAYLAKGGNLELVFEYPILESAEKFSPESLNKIVQEAIAKKWKLEGEKKIENCDQQKTPENIDVFNSANSGNFKNFEEAEAALASSVESELLLLKTQETGINVETKSSAINRQPSCTVSKDKCAKSCKFSYNYQGTASITLTDKTKAYPVKTAEGKTLFENLNFLTENTINLNMPIKE